MKRTGKGLIAVRKELGTEEQCLAFLEALRWPDGVRCLKCGGDKISKFKTAEGTRTRKNLKTGEIEVKTVPARHLYQCLAAACGYQFTATTGTLFNDTHLPLQKWMLAVAIVCNAKEGVSALQLQRDLGVSYKTAWHLYHRVRNGMGLGNTTDEKLEGIVEMTRRTSAASTTSGRSANAGTSPQCSGWFSGNRRRPSAAFAPST